MAATRIIKPSSMKHMTKMLMKEKKLMAKTRSLSASSEPMMLKLDRIETKMEVALTFMSALLETF